MDSKADETDTRAAFRKPSTDVANRKYRRHSPSGDSSSLDGSPKHHHSPSMVHSRENEDRASENFRRGGDRRESDRDHGHTHNSRSGIHRGDKYPPRSYDRHGRDVDDRDRKYQRSPYRSWRDSGSDHHLDQIRSENDYHRSRDHSDRYSRHKHGSTRYRSNDKERDCLTLERKKERCGRGDERREEKRDPYRDSGDHTYSHAERRKDAESERKEKDLARASKDRYEDKFSVASDCHGSPAKKARSSGPEKVSEVTNAADNVKHLTSSKPATVSQDVALPGNSLPKESGFSNDIDAARVAALKAAELVNRNLVGTGYLTTDQKKKLLWGNKKTTATEEPAHRWDATLIGDPDRQEKFNKLMSLRLHWYVCRFVGCEGKYEHGSKDQPSGSSRETEGTPTGSRKAIYCWASSKRWTNRWVRPLSVTFNFQTVKKSFCFASRCSKGTITGNYLCSSACNTSGQETCVSIWVFMFELDRQCTACIFFPPKNTDK